MQTEVKSWMTLVDAIRGSHFLDFSGIMYRWYSNKYLYNATSNVKLCTSYFPLSMQIIIRLMVCLLSVLSIIDLKLCCYFDLLYFICWIFILISLLSFLQYFPFPLPSLPNCVFFWQSGLRGMSLVFMFDNYCILF